MSSKSEESVPSVRTKMESLRLTCDAELLVQQQRMDAFTASFRKSLESAKARAQETVKYQAQIEEVKGKLREAEDDLVKALAVKTRKEAKRMAVMDAIASSKSRAEDLKRSFQEQRTKRDQYAVLISQQSLVLEASEGKTNEGNEHKDERQEAISWYNSVLGFHVEGGHGVKFTFKNINLNNPNEEYSFTIRHESDTYILLNCEPSLKDTKECIHELNKTNGLFKFVRVMRQKFQEAAAKDLITSDHQESALISASAPVSSMSPSTCDSTTKKNEHQVQPRVGNRHFKKQNLGRTVRSTVLSPGSASSVRQSPRLKARK